MRWLALALVAACGRIGFAPTTGDGMPATGDGGPGGDGHASDGNTAIDGTTAIDGAAGACASPTVVVVGTRAAETTCVTDLIDGCGPAATQERVYKFVAPAAGGYQFEALDALDGNINNSIGPLDAACMPSGGCAGIDGLSLGAGEVMYFAVEASAGGCVNVRISISGPT